MWNYGTKKMNKTLFCCLIIILLFFVGILGQKPNSKSSFGILKGQVWLGSPSEYAPKITILIQGNGIKKEIISGNGDYSVNLPEGLYSLSTAETFDNYSFKRAKFRIKANQTTYVSVDPPLKISLITSNDEILKEPKPYYSQLKFFNTSKLDLQIRYFEKKNSGKITEYKNALVTYDALSIYGDKITIDKKDKIVAEGQNVILENNGERSRATWLRFEIKNGEPIIQITKGAIIGIKGNAKLENGLVSLQLDALRNKPDKTGSNFANTLSFQDMKNKVKFVSNYYEVIIEGDNEILLDGTGWVESDKTKGKREATTFTAKIRDYGEANLESEFSINIFSYSFKSKLNNGSLQFLKN